MQLASHSTEHPEMTTNTERTVQQEHKRRHLSSWRQSITRRLRNKTAIQKKLDVKFKGPFIITKVFNNGTYLIRLPRAKEARMKPVHGNRLIRYYEQPRFKLPQVVIEYNPKYHGQPKSSEVSSQPK